MVVTKRLQPGDVVTVRYLDHVFFKDADVAQQEPRTMEAVGRVQKVSDDYLRLVFERYPDGSPVGEETKSMGLVILKSTILELRRI